MSLQPSLTLALAAHWHWGQTRLLLFTEQFKHRKTVIFFSHTAKKCFAKCWFSKKKFENVMSYELHFSVFVWDRLIFQSISCSYHFKNLQAEAEMFLFDVGLQDLLYHIFCFIRDRIFSCSFVTCRTFCWNEQRLPWRCLDCSVLCSKTYPCPWCLYTSTDYPHCVHKWGHAV